MIALGSECVVGKPEGVSEFEDALLVAIMLFSAVTWVAVLMRLLSSS